MHKIGRTVLVFSALLVTAPSLAAECDRLMAEELSSSIRANFTILETGSTQEASEQNKIDMLKENFSEVTKLHSYAIESDDQASLDQACEMYQSILDQQAVMRE